MNFNRLVARAAPAALAMSMGCASEAPLPEAPSEGGATGKADTLETIKTKADQIRTFGHALKSIGDTLGKSEAAIVAVSAGMPLGSLTLRDALDFDEYRDRIDGVLLEGLAKDLDAGKEILSGKGEINLEGETLCEAFNLADEAPEGESTPLQRCEALADAAAIRLAVEAADGVLRVELLTGLSREAHPLVFVVDTNDGLSVDLEIAMPDTDEIIELVEVLGSVDLGDLKEELTLLGTARIHFESKTDGVALSLHLPEDVVLDLGDELAFSAAARGELPLVELLIDPEGEATLAAAIGEVSARTVATVVEEEAPEGQVVDIAWGGFEAIFAGSEDALDFAYAQSAFELSFSGGDVEDYVVSGEVLNEQVTGTIRLDGEIERTFEADLEGFETSYALSEDLKIATEHHGVRAVATFSKDATIVDVLHASSLRKAFFLAAARTRLAFVPGDVERIDSIRCVANGRFEIAVEGGDTFVIDDDSDDRCIVGYFTEDDDVLQMNYRTMFD